MKPGLKSAYIYFIIFLLVIPVKSAFGWGEKGHRIISTNAMLCLPQEMRAFIAWKDYMGEHASDADIRRRTDKTEAPKHFIDIDFYKEFLAGNMIENEDSLVAVYGMDTVMKIGVLPWATLKTYENLVAAFKEKNRDKALIFMADLGHYVADGHQPMHTVVNYNGQLTGQKGIHSRYESHMINLHVSELEKVIDTSNVAEVNNPLKFIFNYISNTNSVCEVLFAADKLAAAESGSTVSEDYYRIMWFRTSYITEVQFEKAEEDLASLMYSAWKEAGKPAFDEFN